MFNHGITLVSPRRKVLTVKHAVCYFDTLRREDLVWLPFRIWFGCHFGQLAFRAFSALLLYIKQVKAYDAVNT